jgi:hypothetical protein
MLTLMPLKTQENAIAKWKREKITELTKWEAVVFS